jgi:hypothetical protein
MVLSPINALHLAQNFDPNRQLGRISAIRQDGVRVPYFWQATSCVAYHVGMKRAFVENK